MVHHHNAHIFLLFVAYKTLKKTKRKWLKFFFYVLYG